MRCPTLDMKGLARLNRIIWWSSLGVAAAHMVIAVSRKDIGLTALAASMMAYMALSREWLRRAERAEEYIEELAWPREEEK